jgi:hypothetical protein
VVVVALLGVPLLVILGLPRLFELASSVPALSQAGNGAAPTPAFRLTEPTSTTSRARFAPVVETPPPTLAPPRAPVQVATARPTATGERVVIGNTGGAGAVLRSDPVTGRQVAALREGLVVDVLERRSVAGSGDWVHVRTPEGVEGWVTGLVALTPRSQCRQRLSALGKRRRLTCNCKATFGITAPDFGHAVADATLPASTIERL